MQYPRVSIILLNWNGWKDTIECLESLYRINYTNYDVIVVDNFSQDESIEKIKEYCEGKIKINSKFFEYDPKNKPINVFEISEDDVKNNTFSNKEKYEKIDPNKRMILIKNKDNYGFTGGNNIGIKFSLNVLNPDYVLLLNNDTVVDPNFLIELVKVAESNVEIGVVGPKVYYYDDPNRVQTCGLVNYKKLFNLKFLYNLFNFEPFCFLKNKEENTIKRVDSLVGCCLLIKSKYLKETELFDEDFFLYYEEFELLFRLSKKCQIYYTPYSKIWHKEGSSSGGYLSKTFMYYNFRNALLFAKKHYNFIRYLIFIIVFIINSHGIVYIKHKAWKKPQVLKYYYKGLLDGFLGKTGKRI